MSLRAPRLESVPSLAHHRRAGPPGKWPRVVKEFARSQIIFRMANKGTARSAPANPHIQYHNARDTITSTGLRTKRRAISWNTRVGKCAHDRLKGELENEGEDEWNCDLACKVQT